MEKKYWFGLALVVGWCLVTRGLTGTINYSYNDAGSLIRADYGSGRIDYSYDNNGNLIQRHTVGFPVITLPDNCWQQYALPANPGVSNRLQDIFGDDISGDYGVTWHAYRYDTATGQYQELNAQSVIQQGEGFWIIQMTGSDVTVDMPDSSTITPVAFPRGCLSENGCFSIPIHTGSESPHWNMAGYMFSRSEDTSNFRVVTGSSTPVTDCSAGDGCTLAQARAANVLHDVFWHYVNDETGYRTIQGAVNLNGWDGFWAAALSGAPTDTDLIVPKP